MWLGRSGRAAGGGGLARPAGAGSRCCRSPGGGRTTVWRRGGKRGGEKGEEWWGPMGQNHLFTGHLTVLDGKSNRVSYKKFDGKFNRVLYKELKLNSVQIVNEIFLRNFFKGQERN